VIAIALAFGASVAWGFSDFLGGMRAKRIAITGVVGMTEVFALKALDLRIQQGFRRPRGGAVLSTRRA
jgi:hypothetical protein